jgi:hypothetical protein
MTKLSFHETWLKPAHHQRLVVPANVVAVRVDPLERLGVRRVVPA